LSHHDSISDQEISLLNDQQFLLAKRAIDSKVTKLLLDSQHLLKKHILTSKLVLPAEISLSPRKVAKGENYGSLPYWVSDFPASMNKKHIWSFRTVVWWGNEISFSLILKGKFKPELVDFIMPTDSNEVLYNLHTDPWMLELNQASTVDFSKPFTEAVQAHHLENDFTKLTVKIALEKINSLGPESVNSFIKLIGSLKYLA
jgi:hypothetical protein